MLLPNLSWGFFALVQNHQGEILIKQRTDGQKLWDLPGGGADKGEASPLQVLRRELTEELGLSLLAVKAAVGSPLPHYDQAKGKVDVAQAFACLTRGEPCLTEEAQAWKYIDRETAFAWLRSPSPGKTFVGPAGRIGRMTRMVLDGVVIGQEPSMRFPSDVGVPPAYALPESHDYQVSPDGVHIVKVDSTETRVWRRLDPFAPQGLMERS